VAMERMTKFGRDFSVVAVPYSLKLLMQELQAINVQMRIITEDNVSQLGALSYSQNLQKLTFDAEMTPAKLVEQIRQQVDQAPLPTANTPRQLTPAGIPPAMPVPEDVSPVYQPEEVSPPYPEDVSPAYQPEEVSPPYPEDVSPAYQPEEAKPSTLANIANTIGNTIGNFFTPKPQQGGHLDLHDMYQIHEPVFYNQSASFGLAPDHPWYVSKIGQKYVTIRTDAIGPDMTMHDSVQVVHPEDIYRPSEVPCERPQIEGEYHTAMPVTPPVSTYADPRQSSDGIQFAPVIKIFNGNGNDNSTSKATTNDGYENAEENDAPMYPNATTVIRNDSAPKAPSALSETNVRNHSEQSGGSASEPKSILSKAAVNFSNFVIKKLG